MLAYMDRAAAATKPEGAGEPGPVAAGCATATDFGGLVSAMPGADRGRHGEGHC
jgi:cytokinin dehydrogenase